MSSEPSAEAYAILGKHLRYAREQQQESLAEVSGAVEIDEQELARIESGKQRPPEDILMLLINHFDLRDQEAVRLWELAGYEGEGPERLRLEDIAAESGKPIIVLLGVDGRTMYTDAAEITTTEAGVTMWFGQQGKNQTMPVAKLGMSHDQAERVLAQLQRAILQHRYGSAPKQLPPPTDIT